jgi:hypothetical protein
MNHNIAGMVVVASGSSAMVAQWSGLLRKAAIEFEVSKSLGAEEVGHANHLEIWVENDDVEEARSLLTNSGNGNKSLLW